MKIKLKIMGVMASVLLMVSGASAECTLNGITLDTTVSGSWSGDCNSTHRSGRYAQYYTFTLANTETISLKLESLADTYMFLLLDANLSGTVIDFNDDYDGLNSRIVRELPAGTYTIEATTFNPGTLGDFNLTLSKIELDIYHFKGTVDLPAIVLSQLENCTMYDCPTVSISSQIMLSDGSYQYPYSQVDYNDTTGKYEYQYSVTAEANTSIEIYTYFDAYWEDIYVNEGTYIYASYTFGEDQALGGTGFDADYALGECDTANQTALHVDLSTPLPMIDLDLSDYIPLVKSKAVMILDNVPANTYVDLYGVNENYCGGGSGYSFPNGDGSVTIEADNLVDGYEYGLKLNIYDQITFIGKEYRLNDNDGDFTNGGVFVEDMVYSEFDYSPVFDKTIFATPDDINISTPENLNFGNPALIPTIYLLLM